MKRIVILGGSFNPVHSGHLRLALETGEAMRADQVDFVPSFRPPHKNPQGILPFELRLAALQCALNDYSGVHINQFEAESEEPSYSLYTLQDYVRRVPKAELYFVLGLHDFAQLDSWHRWQEFAKLANLLVVPRENDGEKEFLNVSQRLFPGCARTDCAPPQISLEANPEAPRQNAPRTGMLVYLPVPRLDISSSLIREKWLQGRCMDFLLPECVIELLYGNADVVAKAWGLPPDSEEEHGPG